MSNQSPGPNAFPDPESADMSQLGAVLAEALEGGSWPASRWSTWESWIGSFQARLASHSMSLGDGERQRVARLYRQAPEGLQRHHLLLSLLATDQQAASLQVWRELLLERPPSSIREAGAAFAPLLAHRSWDPDALFPELLDGLDQLVIAPLILDLANFVKRRALRAEHPAVARSQSLTQLLAQLAERLSLLQQQAMSAAPPSGLGRQITEAVSLAVSCCDALALIGDPRCTPALYKTLDVPHRRLQVEAAYALARCQEPAGLERLVELASEPVVRSRVLAYASELGQLDSIAAEHRAPAARAQAELVQMLADPTQFGVPPLSCELIDQRSLAWPGFEEPVDCYLFEYAYPTSHDVFVGRGLVGPLTRAPRLDLSPLSVAETYAYFAGWQAEHQDIREVPSEQFTAEQSSLAQQLAAQVPPEWSIQQLLFLGYFFERQLLVTVAQRRTELEPPQPGTLVIGQGTMAWLPEQIGGGAVPALGPRDHYCLVKGTELLSQFNSGFPFPDPPRP